MRSEGEVFETDSSELVDEADVSVEVLVIESVDTVSSDFKSLELVRSPATELEIKSTVVADDASEDKEDDSTVESENREDVGVVASKLLLASEEGLVESDQVVLYTIEVFVSSRILRNLITT